MQKRILLIIGGGIAAYKSLYLIRELSRRGIASRVILTKAGSEFVTALSASALSGDKVYTDLFNLTDEAEMGHIELSRSADLIVVAPATADLLAKAAHGLANDLASTALLATDKPILFAPAMNVRMWEAPATQRNIETLRADGANFIGPDQGEMACGEFGAGRMAEPDMIADKVEALLGGSKGQSARAASAGQLTGRRALVTAGPTRENIDPVRYLSNRSSGKQGYAIAEALASAGADVTLVSGPVCLDPPSGVKFVSVQSAEDMMDACQNARPYDIFVSVAAVADYRPDTAQSRKVKKSSGDLSVLSLQENPDILQTISKGEGRPKLVIGFAAETHDVIQNARAKLKKKGCDWIMANDVSGDVMGGDFNQLIKVTQGGEEIWPRQDKQAAARQLASEIAKEFNDEDV